MSENEVTPDAAVEAERTSLEDRGCLLCGMTFAPKVEGQVFCSSSHRHKYRHAKNKNRMDPGYDRCPATAKISYATLEDAMAYTKAANNPILNAYKCHCGSWHWGRHLTTKQREGFDRMTASQVTPAMQGNMGNTCGNDVDIGTLVT